jgi:Raf kinase inhibitor-like YbhB/YbcL family protein
MFQKMFCLCISILFFCFNQTKSQSSIQSGGIKMKMTSKSFKEGEMIPGKYTCDDADISPHLEWSLVPEGTKTFAIICDDPDAPMGTWVHWIIFNIPGNVRAFLENIHPIEVLPEGTKQGKNDFGRIGYGGPCPPSGIHRYYFKIYALDVELDLKAGIRKTELLSAMDGHILAEGQLMGRYKR